MGKRIITPLFILLPITLFAQNKTEQIVHIKQVVTAINMDSTLVKVVLNNEYLESLRPNGEAPDNGEEITGYFRRDTLVKVIDWVGLSHCMKTYEFYINSGKPVFVFAKQADYNYNNKTATMDYAHKTEVFEGRYYFNKGIIIKKIEKGNSIPTKGKILEMLRGDIPKYSKILFKEYRKRRLR